MFNGRAVVHESGLEQRVSTAIRARRDIVELRAQQPKVKYQGDDGKYHYHYFDYWVKFSDGFEVAVAVKYQERVAKLKAQMNLLRKTASYSFDDIVILTENDVDQGDFRNALVVLLTREHHDQAEIEKLLGEIRGRTKFQFFEMYHKDVDRKKRFTAIWRLIDAGVLAPLQRGWINNVSWLKVTL